MKLNQSGLKIPIISCQSVHFYLQIVAAFALYGHNPHTQQSQLNSQPTSEGNLAGCT